MDAPQWLQNMAVGLVKWPHELQRELDLPAVARICAEIWAACMAL